MSGYGDLGAMAFENPSRLRTRALRARKVARSRAKKQTVRRLQGRVPAHRIGRGKTADHRKANRRKYAALVITSWSAGQPQEAVKALILASNNGSSARKVSGYGLKRLPQDQHTPWKEFIRQSKPYVPSRRRTGRRRTSLPGVFVKGGRAAPFGKRAIVPGVWGIGASQKPGFTFPASHFQSTSASQAQIEQEVAAMEAEDVSSYVPSPLTTMGGIFGSIFGQDELLDENSDDGDIKKAAVVAALGLAYYLYKRQ
jgi:hypothetical protein